MGARVQCLWPRRRSRGLQRPLQRQRLGRCRLSPWHQHQSCPQIHLARPPAARSHPCRPLRSPRCVACNTFACVSAACLISRLCRPLLSGRLKLVSSIRSCEVAGWLCGTDVTAASVASGRLLLPCRPAVLDSKRTAFEICCCCDIGRRRTRGVSPHCSSRRGSRSSQIRIACQDLHTKTPSSQRLLLNKSSSPNSYFPAVSAPVLSVEHLKHAMLPEMARGGIGTSARYIVAGLQSASLIYDRQRPTPTLLRRQGRLLLLPLCIEELNDS